jgi:hypothetical protein
VPFTDPNKLYFKRRWVLMVAGVAVLTAVGVGALVHIGTLGPPDPDQAAIRRTVEQGLLAQQDALSPGFRSWSVNVYLCHAPCVRAG